MLPRADRWNSHARESADPEHYNPREIMPKPKVIVVEDEYLIAGEIEHMISQIADVEVRAVPSVAEFWSNLGPDVVFVFLDGNVTDGETWNVAQRLQEQRKPFAFITAYGAEHAPEPVRQVPFIPKPPSREDLVNILKQAVPTVVR